MPKILLPLLFWCCSAVLFAQGTARVNINGVPSALSSPFIADIQADYNAGRFPIQFIYTNPSKQPTRFRFRLSIQQDGQSLAEIDSEVAEFTPGIYTYSNLRSRTPNIVFPDLGTVIAGLQDDIRSHINQTGALPEGDYELEIEPVLVDEDPLLITSAGRAMFNVRFPDPALLLSPADESNVAVTTPVFTWLPATVPANFTPEYKLLIVEILEGQTPEDALTGNRKHLETEWMPRRTSFAYTPDLLPFEEGKRYAWATRIRTSPQNLPFNDDGYSEIRTFTFRSGFAAGSPLAALRSLVLEPGFATLTNLTGLNVREEGGFYVLNGETTLNLQTAPTQELPINITNLRLSRADVNSISGGTFEVDLNGLQLEGISNLVQLNQLRWTFGSGFSTNLEITLPNGRKFSPSDFIGFGQRGLSGNFSFAVPDVSIGNNPVQFTLQNINVRFPENSISGSGYLNLFGGTERCTLPLVALSADGGEAAFSCDFNENIQLVSGSNLLRLNLRRVEGSVTMGETFSHNLQINGGLQLSIENGASCGADLRVNLSTLSGFSAENIVPNCRVANPQINLGFLDAAFQNIRIPILNFDPRTRTWDFAVDIDINFLSETLGGMQLPQIPNIRIDRNGIQLPRLNFDAEDLAGILPFRLGDFMARMKGFNVTAPFSFNWFNFDQLTAGDWRNVAIDFDFDIPNLGGLLPACMRQRLDAPSLSFSGASVNFNLPANLIDEPGCSIGLGGSTTLNVQELGGNLRGAFSEGRFNIASVVNVAGNIHLGAPFTCGESEGLTIGSTRLSIYGDGLLEGRIENLTPSCPLQFGTYTATPLPTTLVFTRTGGRQGMQLIGGANLAFAPGQTVSGTYDLDVLNGRFNSYSFNLDQPFDWAVPTENPVFTFRINQATLNQDGFLIDGRNRINFPEGGGSMGVTFDNLQVNLQTASIASGNITFDGAFGFQLDFGVGDGLRFKAVSTSHELSISPGMLLRGQGTMRIDRDGLTMSGSSTAQFRYREFNLNDSVSLNFRDGFRFSFAPFGVNRGAVDVVHDGARLAYLDATGINLDPSIVGAFAPERLPLPNENVAYLQLRDPVTRSFLVSFTPDGSGNYNINTLPGQQVRLYMPALQGNSPTVPYVGISLSNVLINPASLTLRSGEIRADVATVFAGLLPNFPLQLQEVVFATQNYQGASTTALFLNGQLRMFNETVNCPSTLYIQSDLRTRGVIECRGINQDINLTTVEDVVVLRLQDILAAVNVDMSGRTPMTFNMNATAALRFQNTEGGSPEVSYEEQLSLEITESGMSLRSHAETDFPDPPSVNLGFAALAINRVRDIALAYNNVSGFTFDVSVDMRLDFPLAGALVPGGGKSGAETREGDLDGLSIPLEEVSITHTGISFPPIDLHGETFRLPEIDMGAVGIRPIAFRMPRSSFTWSPLSVSANPEFDFEIRLSQLGRSSGEVDAARLTINRARIENGILAGTLVPYSFSRDGASVDFGAGEFYMRTVSGRMFNDGGNQGYDFSFTAGIDTDGFQPEAGAPAPVCTTNLAGRISSTGGIEGTVNNFAPCGTLSFEPLSIEFTRSDLTFNFGGRGVANRVELRGTVEASLAQEGTAPATATGNFGLSLLDNSILESDLTMRNFRMNYPTAQPIFNFTVNEARIDRDGFSMNANGRANFPGGSFVTVDFNDATFAWEGFALQSGDITFEAPFALQGILDTGNWAMVPVGNAIPAGNVFRLDLPNRLVLDRDGLSISGTAAAQLRYGAETWPSLNLGFDNFSLGFGPVNVRRGRMDFNLVEGGVTNRLAYFDSEGFHPDNIIAILPIPARLPLGSMDVAYLQLRSGNNNSDPLLIETNDLGSGQLQIRTRPGQAVSAHFPSLNGDPSANVTFDIVLNTGDFSINAVNSFAVSTSESLDSQLFGSFPLHLQRFELRKPAGLPLSLTADIRLNLPASMTTTPVLIEDLTISEAGFDGARLRAGSVSNTYQPSCATSPFLSSNFGGNSVALALCGFEVQMTGSNITRVAMSGQLSGDFLEDDAGARQRLHLNGAYSAGAWTFGVDFSHVPGGKIAMGFMELQPSVLSLFASSTEFYVGLDGRVTFPTIGNDFAITIDGLRMGSAGVTLNRAELVNPQDFSLFDDNLQLHLARMGLSKPTNESPLFLTMTGSMDVLDQSGISFTDFRIGTDGSVSIGAGEVNFLQARPIEIVEDIFTVDRLVLGVADNRFYMEAGANVTLPAPLSSSARGILRMSLDPGTGNVTINPMTIAFTFDSTPGNGRGVEFAIPEVATLELSGAGVTLDFQHPEESAFFASASLFIQNNASKEIQFGRGVDVVNNWGIRATPNSFAWRVTRVSAIDIETDFFSITGLTITTPIPDRFRLNISGTASLRMSGVSGSATINNMIIDDTGLVSPGTLAGMEISLQSIATIRIGAFTTGNNQDLTLETASGGLRGGITNSSVTIPVTEFMRIGASNITVAGAFSGRFTEILYYKQSRGQATESGGTCAADECLAFKVRGVEMTFGGDTCSSAQFCLTASMEYVQEGGDFLLRVAGSGRMPSAGIGFGVVGKIGVRGGEPTFGIFAVVSATIPLYPGVVDLTGVGLGFFYRPDAADINLVIDVLQSATDFRVYSPDNIPRAEGMTICVMLYASVGLIGSVGNYAVEAQAFLDFSAGPAGWSFGLQIRGTMLRQGRNLVAGMYIRIEDVNDRLMIAGGAKVLVDYSAVASGKAEVEFKFIKNGAADPIWAITGNIGGLNAADINFKGGGGSPTDAFKIVTIINVNGKFIVCNQGFLFDLRASLGFDFWIISINTNIQMSVWYRNHAGVENIGAYAEIGLRASVLGGLAEMGATAKAAFISVNGNTLLYGSARGYVKVLFVFEGSISLWLACENGSWSGGEGTNARYDQMVADARAQAEEMENIANEAAGSLEAAAGEMPDLSLSEAQLLAAATGLADMPIDARRAFASAAQNNEVANGVWTSGLSVANAAIIGTDPDVRQIEAARARMDASIARSLSAVGAVSERLRAATATAYEDLGTLETADNNLRNPISAIVTTWSGDTPPSYTIDDSQAAQNVNDLETIRAEIAALDVKYQETIAAATENINKIDDALSGSPLLDMQAYIPANMLRESVVRQYVGAFGGASAAANLGVSIRSGAPIAYVGGSGSVVSNTSAVGLGIVYTPVRSGGAVIGGYSGNATYTAAAALTPARSAIISTLAPVRALNGRSVNYIAGLFTRSIEDIDAFYAQNASFKWKLRADYTLRLNRLNLNRSNIETEIANAGNGINDKARLIRLGSTRANLLAQLQSLDANAAATTFTNAANPANINAVREQTRIKGVELWSIVPRRTFELLIDRIPTEVTNEFNTYQTKRTEFVEKYNEFSIQIDDLYAVKARMMSTLYGMIDQYILWKRAVQGPTALGDWETLKTQFGRLLEPPSISAINFSPVKNPNEYYSKANFTWTASHPDGLVEYAFSADYASDGADISGTQPFLTTGIENNIDIYRFKRSASGNLDNINIRVKARSPGGNTLIRAAQVRVNVGTGGSNVNGGNVGGAVLQPDYSPADILSIAIKEGDTYTVASGTSTPYTGREGQPVLPPDPLGFVRIIGGLGGGLGGGLVIGGGGGAAPAPIWGGQQLIGGAAALYLGGGLSGGGSTLTRNSGITARTPGLWINATDQFEFQVTATDPESDIALFEYALGTTSGGTDVKSWEPLVGARSRSSNSAQVTLSAKVRSLSLNENQTYYLSVRAKNGQGWWSQYRQVTPIYIDVTAPSRPTETSVVLESSGGFFVGGRGIAINIGAPTPTAPFSIDPMFSNPRVATQASRATIQKAVAFTASSDMFVGRNGSGIRRYRYVLSTQADSSRAISTADSIYTTTYLQNELNAAKLDFTRTFYVYFWAEDYAGNKSAVARSAGFIVTDPSIPKTPVIQVGRKSSYFNIALFSQFIMPGAGVPSLAPESMLVTPVLGVGLTRLSTDLESNVVGYRVAVGTSPGRTDLVPFRVEGVDYVVDNATVGAINEPSARPPLFAVSTDGLPRATNLYVSIIAVNGQGQTSNVATSGEIQLDGTRPLPNTITFNASGSNFVIGSEGVADQESGISNISYRLLNGSDRTVLRGNTVLFQSGNPPTWVPAQTYTISKPAGLSNLQSVILQITFTNGAGTTSTREVTYTPLYHFVSPDVSLEVNIPRAPAVVPVIPLPPLIVVPPLAPRPVFGLVIRR